MGYQAAANVGVNNVAIGTQALAFGGNFNTAVGHTTLRNCSGNSNVGIGLGAGSSYTGSESNNIVLAHLGTSGDSGVIRIGTSGTQNSCYIAGINGVATNLDAVPVLVDSNGQLVTISSSLRYKKNIQDTLEQAIIKLMQQAEENELETTMLKQAILNLMQKIENIEKKLELEGA